MQSRSTCTKPVAVAPGRALGGPAGRRRFTAGRGAGCMAVRLALAGLRASATATTGTVSTRRKMQTRLRAMRDLAREVKDLTRKLGGGLRSAKFKPEGAR